MGTREDDGPFEGVPVHLQDALKKWLGPALRDGAQTNEDVDDRAMKIAVRLRLATPGSSPRLALTNSLLFDPERFLDVLDMALSLSYGHFSDSLNSYLDLGGSVWTVAPDGLSLRRRVTAAEQDAYMAAVTPLDEASDQLKQAWRAAYGRDPDPSGAWHHSIKAVETLLWSLVIPNNPKATLGLIISALQAKPGKWTFRLGPAGVEAFTSVLCLIWPNPDRHGSGDSRQPTVEESETVVQTAVAVVGWLRKGALAHSGSGVS